MMQSTRGRKSEGEGGCGVIGMACNEKIAGKHLLPSLYQMRNRGNGKGGGIAAAGLSSQALGVSSDILHNDYLLAIAYLDEGCRDELEREYIHPFFQIDHVLRFPHLPDFKAIKDLAIRPPEAILYFVRVKKKAIENFREKHQAFPLPSEAIEGQIVYENSYKLNQTFYSATGEKKAFVLSHGKNLLVLKMVGYGDDVIRYYNLENFQAHVWIGHHRYPTKGKVWHPGGAHPFVGLNEALVHNGDFANYYSICEYLSQKDIHPLFLTDTEVSVLLFDLLHRTYQYQLEYVIEAMAPTTERDFSLLSSHKQAIYKQLQKTHMHGSPDGPWFFLIAQSLKNYRLIGITDTSMLRPQVFAIQKGDVSIGLSASEKQAIDAALESLAKDDNRFWSQADHYWNARGGSSSDGGAFIFTVLPETENKAEFRATDKFGRAIHTTPLPPAYKQVRVNSSPLQIPDLPSHELYRWAVNHTMGSYDQVTGFLAGLSQKAETEENFTRLIEVLTKLIDQRYPLSSLRRSSLRTLFTENLTKHFDSLATRPRQKYAYLSFAKEHPDLQTGQTLVIDASDFPPEGEQSLAQEVIRMYQRGFIKFILYNLRGQRFIVNGLGPDSSQVHMDVYGSSGDYLASGVDGAEVHVHGSGQDQLGQIMNNGTLIVHGDVGQAFMYGAKGGCAFIRGNTAGRPLINAVGKPRVVINGTCLDYLAESFMAGNPLKGGGFVIVNGIAFDEEGKIVELETPYPGNNLFSLASGGAIYFRDPQKKITEEQLNGGMFAEMTELDWELILPYLEDNARHFEIPVKGLLTSDGKAMEYHQVYRKISPAPVRVLQEEEAWVKKRD